MQFQSNLKNTIYKTIQHNYFSQFILYKGFLDYMVYI